MESYPSHVKSSRWLDIVTKTYAALGLGATQMKTAIFHNHPIHYQHLLFQELNRKGLKFEVFFLAAASDVRFEMVRLGAEAGLTSRGGERK